MTNPRMLIPNFMKRFQLKEIKVSSRMIPIVKNAAGKNSTGGSGGATSTGGGLTSTIGGGD